MCIRDSINAEYGKSTLDIMELLQEEMQPPSQLTEVCVVLESTPGLGMGSGGAEVDMGNETKEVEKSERCCYPCAFLLASPFMLLGLILFPFGLVFKLLKYICCCAPGGCCMSCIFGAAEWLTELPCKIYDCFKCIPC
eukprot:TRINITY_DN4463_c0_g1_i6.p1 TRINITY_DN4463_c0_g1~~TRINITY_DN4463_c0_g1_i6.p1  ORF type:complete len:138 (-),score=27.22 TRINITY_DN4463_c0_g1_i6:483-896(-)